MKLEQVLSARVVRIMEISTPDKSSFNGPALARGCEERYAFLQGPRVVADYNLETGVNFLRGNFDGRVIERFQVYLDGLVVEGQGTTSDMDNFLDDFAEWVERTASVKVGDIADGNRYYISSVEVSSDILIESFLNILTITGQDVAKYIRLYGHETNDFIVKGFHLGTDAPLPTFTFERRENKPSGTYFSSAPLRTVDHLHVLERLETLMAATSAS